MSLVGQNNFSALKPNESFSEARNRLRTFKPGQFNKASNYLELFPHWAGEAGQKIAKQTGQTTKLTNLLDTVQDKTSPYFIVQSQLGNASWNSEVKTWQGKAVDQLRSKIDSADEKYVKSYSKASSLVNQQLSIT